MSVEVKLLGRLEYDDEAAMSDALFEAAELLEGEDPDLKELLEHEGFIAIGHNWVSIELEVSMPWAWSLVLDDIVEILCEPASRGRIELWHEGEKIDPYLAGDEVEV